MIQGSEEWRMARLGCATASRIADATARIKNGWGASRAAYMAELIAERLTGLPFETYTNAAMARGTELEPEARAAYAFYADVEVIEVGFVPHPMIPMSGASPDGLIGDDGLLEIKCPNVSTHIDTLLGAPIDGRYMKQMQWQMACSGRRWCDWISYDPRLPQEMRLFVKRVPRDLSVIAALEKDVIEFLDEVEAKTRALSDRYLQRKAA